MQSSSSTAFLPGLWLNEWLTNDDIAFKNKRPHYEFKTEEEMESLSKVKPPKSTVTATSHLPPLDDLNSEHFDLFSSLQYDWVLHSLLLQKLLHHTIT